MVHKAERIANAAWFGSLNLNGRLARTLAPPFIRLEQVCIARGKIFPKLPPVLNPFIHWIEAKGPYAPWLFLALFLAASLLMIWRLEVLSAKGFEGTVLGTLVMPYCTGMGNLIFAFILGRNGGSGADVMVNSLVNNVTNMTLVLGLPAIFWGMKLLPAQKKKSKSGGKTHELNRLSSLLTLTAVLFFTGVVWTMGRKGRIDFNDGLILVGLFLFWQCFHVFDVLKNNVRQGKSLSWTLPFDLALLAVGAYGIYVSTGWLVAWISNIQTGFISVEIPRLAQRLADGAAERDPGVLLRLAQTAGNRLCLASRRRARVYPAVHRHLRAVSHDGLAAVFSHRECSSSSARRWCISFSSPCLDGCRVSSARCWSPPTDIFSGKACSAELHASLAANASSLKLQVVPEIILADSRRLPRI